MMGFDGLRLGVRAGPVVSRRLGVGPTLGTGGTQVPLLVEDFR
jgi:hypothetical protein